MFKARVNCITVAIQVWVCRGQQCDQQTAGTSGQRHQHSLIQRSRTQLKKYIAHERLLQDEGAVSTTPLDFELLGKGACPGTVFLQSKHGFATDVKCQEWCNGYPGCNLLSFEAWRGICTLRFARPRPTPPCPGDGLLSYWKMTLAVPTTIPDFELLGNGACPGTVVLRNNLKVGTAIKCQEVCNGFSGCNLVSFIASRGLCTLRLAPSRPTTPCQGGVGLLSFWTLTPAVPATIPDFELLGNGACPGTVVLRNNLKVGTAIKCQEVCNGFSGCNLVSFEAWRGLCTLRLASSRPTTPCQGGVGLLSFWTLTPAVPATIPDFELLGNGACPGRVILRNNLKVGTAIKCQEVCNGFSGCNLVSFEAWRGLCTLRLASSRPTTPCQGGVGLLSFWTLTPAVPATIPDFELLGNGACSGAVHMRKSNAARGAGNSGINNHTHCQEWCKTYPGCNLASYEFWRGICTLWLAPTHPTPPCSDGNPGILSYWKLTPAVPATVLGYELLGNGACGERESPGTIVLRSSNGARGAGNVGIKDQLHCQEWCSTFPGCNVASYEHYRGICTLRQAPSRPTPPCSGSIGLLSYWKLVSTTTTTTRDSMTSRAMFSSTRKANEHTSTTSITVHTSTKSSTTRTSATSTTKYVSTTSTRQSFLTTSTTTNFNSTRRAQRPRSPHRKCPPAFGHNSSLTEAGYASLACQCCTPEMETFLRRVVASQGFFVCNEGGLQGFLIWFDCIDHGKTFNNLVQEVVSSAHGDCAWVSRSQEECSNITGCGVFPDVHRRRRCGSGQTDSLMS